MLNRFLFMLFCILNIAVMCFFTLIELVLNFLPFILFEDYPARFASDLISDMDRLKTWLFGV